MVDDLQLPEDKKNEREKPKAFFVLSPAKLVVLTMASLGLYTLYWNWRHWQTIRDNDNSAILPIMRAIFSIFFVSFLFRRFADNAAKIGDRFSTWQPFTWAIAYIVVSIASSIMSEYHNKYPQPEILVFVALILFQTIMVVITLKAQIVANYASGDETGESNMEYQTPEKILLFVSVGLWMMFISAIFVAS